MKSFIVAFTGHRSYRHEADIALGDTIATLYNMGAKVFRVGMAEGFDLAAAEAVLRLCTTHDDICLEAYIPYNSFAMRFSEVDRGRYNQIVNRCSKVVYVSASYHSEAYKLRNDMLVDGAQVVVAWWNGRPSGTGYTVSRGRSNRCRIVNLFGESQYELAF